MNRFKLVYLTFLLGAMIVFAIPSTVVAQDAPEQTEAPKKKRKRIKQKKLKGDQAKSNRKQLRQTRFKIRSRKGDKAYKGDITGRKFKIKRTPRKTYARPQYDPYAGRRIRKGEVDRAGPEPPPTFRSSPQGEKPYRGDITGKRRIRTKSASSARRKVFPQGDPYAGREQRSAERAAKIRRAQVASRSASRSAERKGTVSVGRPPSVSGNARIRRLRNPYSGKEQRRGEVATDRDIAGRKLRTRNTRSARGVPRGGYKPVDTYYGRKAGPEGGRFSRSAMAQGRAPSISLSGEQRGGRYREPEMKNYRSPRAKITGPSFDPYKGRKISGGEKARAYGKPRIRTTARSGERKTRAQVTIPRSISGTGKIQRPKNPYAGREQRSGERATNRDIAGRRLRTRNYRSPRPQWGQALRQPEPYYGRKDRGDRASKYVPKGGTSISGRIWNNKGIPIAVKPPSAETQKAGQFRGRFRPFDLQPGYADDKAMSRYQGRFRPFELNPGYADDKAMAKYQGNFRLYELKPGYANDKAIARYQGRFRPFELNPGYADDKAMAKYQGRFRPYELQPGYSEDKKIARFQGNIRAGKPLKGGGSISGRLWNNKGMPIGVKPPSSETQMATQFRGRFRPFELQPGYADDKAMAKYQGRFRPFELNPGYADDKAMAKYKGRFRPYELQPGYSEDKKIARFQGNIKAGKPLKGGGSISGRLWNNKGMPIAVKPPSSETQMATQFRGRFRLFELQPGYADDKAMAKYQGRFRPFELNPGYADDKAMAKYQGNIRAGRPLKGGGSISGEIWNNKGRPIGVKPPSSETQMATQFQGRFRLFELNPGQMDDRAVARYQGNVKARKPLKGAGGSISGRLWNNKERPLGAKPPSSETQMATQFQGRFRLFELNPGYMDDKAVAKYQGNVKAGKPMKGAGGSISGKLWNNNESPLPVQQPGRDAARGTRFQGNLNASKFGAPSQSEGTEYGRARSVVLITPKKAKNYKAFVRTSGSNKPSGEIEYGRSRKLFFLFLPPSKSNLETANITKSQKPENHNYGQVQSLFFMTPAKAKNYKGYVSRDSKILDIFSSRKQMHPSYNITHDDLNAKDEKEKTFRFKVWWAKIFGSNDNQPQNLKSKDKKPRYDKREAGIWYE